MREYVGCETKELNVKSTDLPPLPSELVPEGLSADRQKYLYDGIRPFCRPGTEDLVCPDPAPVQATKRSRLDESPK